MMNSFQNNPNKRKIVKELVEPSRGGKKEGFPHIRIISTNGQVQN